MSVKQLLSSLAQSKTSLCLQILTPSAFFALIKNLLAGKKLLKGGAGEGGEKSMEE